jgi:hypothetical protein
MNFGCQLPGIPGCSGRLPGSAAGQPLEFRAGSVVLAGLQLLLPPAPSSDAKRKDATEG